MFVKHTSTRVRYAETDRMGLVYYGNYAQYFEIARTEAIRSLGVSYKELENQGVMLPVLRLEVKYLKPAFYDELLSIKTVISEVPTTRITFEHEIYNEAEELTTLGSVQLVFVDAKTRKPRRAPDSVVEKLREFIEP